MDLSNPTLPEITDGYEIQLHHALGHDRWLLTDGIRELKQVAKTTEMTAHCGRYNPAYERYFVPVSESAPQ